MVLETIWNYLSGRKRTHAESDLPVDAEHVQGGSKRFRNAESRPQSADRIYTTSQPILHASSRPPVAPLAPNNAPLPPRNEPIPVQHSKSLSSLDTNKRITIAPPSLAPSNFKFTYTASQTLPTSTTGASETSHRPERKLKRNPNGPISYNGQWKSSKKLNRHASPAFQVPARKPRAESKDAYEVPADSKRRKVTEGGVSKQAESVPLGQVPAAPAATSPTTAPGRTSSSSISPPKPSPLPSASRLRTPAKPTTPAKPSPLRQTWSSQPTQTATLMAELITKTELPKKPDVSNPYQTANPIANAIPPRRATRRTKKPLDRGAIQKAKAEEEAQKAVKEEKAAAPAKKEKEVPYVSAQAQIEATLPPGSKRSRPPANLAQQVSPSSSQTPPKPYIVEEVVDDSEESSRSTKRSKPSSTSSDIFAKSKASSLASEPTIVDLDEVDSGKDKEKQTADSGTTKPSVPATPSPFGGNTAGNLSRQPTMKSIPKEPSKLRNSFLPETAPSPTSSFGAPSPPPAATTFTTTTTTSAAAAPSAQPTPSTPSSFFGPTASAFKTTPPTSSSFTFKPTLPSASSSPANSNDTNDAKAAKDENMDMDDAEVKAKARVRTMAEWSLPVYDFIFSAPSPTLNTSREHIRGREDVKVLPAAALPSFAFDGQEVKKSASGSSGSGSGSSAPGGFKFDLPGTSSAGLSSKPLFGNTAAASSAPAPDPSSFVFGASKNNAPASSSASSSAPAAPAPATGFNWAAAGMKAPDTSDKWLCAVCDVRNAQASTKCVACESDRPGAPSSSSSSSASAPSSFLFGSSKPTPVDAPKPPAVPAVVGFNWAAAGMKAPDTSDKWVCAVCDVRNAQASKKCVSCESDRPGAATAAAAGPSSSFSSALFGSLKPASVEAPKPPAPPSSSSSASFGSLKPASVEAPKPPAAPAAASFNWAAAGMKAPDTSDKWVCAVCDVRNAQAAKKCVSCESDKPGAAPPFSFGSPAPAPGGAPKPPAVPVVTGFNWAAAGMKAPDTSNKWTCSLCGLSNEQKAAQCETCETPR